MCLEECGGEQYDRYLAMLRETKESYAALPCAHMGNAVGEFSRHQMGHAIHELDLFFLDFRPLHLDRSYVGKCIRTE